MFGIVLLEPEIPPNTGNIIRLSANVGAHLHLIKPLGFSLDDRQLRRAGLDYHEWAHLTIYENFLDFQDQNKQARLFACSTRGTQNYANMSYQAGDLFLFGPETRGLPSEILETFNQDHILRIPMQPNIRSLNLSNAVAVIIYEAWRQNGFHLKNSVS